MIASKSNHLPKAPSPDTITLGIRASTLNEGVEGQKHSVHNIMIVCMENK